MDQKLAAAIARHTSRTADMLFDDETIERVVHQHQRMFPADWQEYSAYDKGLEMTDMLNAAAEARETSAARIVMFHS